uniref:Solute carrier family 39 (Zinc transporter), member 1/2/3 n=1 Tax=Kwoniella bestiolae CBS 10118 TaxID=1296100 RepID=A0A1B9G1E9_9TREE|nr:hypothetical protein I302_06310 [Kwoniella bestiolae CBS 10118]OCF24849.1 hypothetical protein I302_06310 [Kwoniella bestiolae CBS 10118]
MAIPTIIIQTYILSQFILPFVNAQSTTNPGSPLCTSSTPGSYDLGLHIVSVFVLLVASAIGVFLPVFMAGNVHEKSSSASKRDEWVRRVFFVLKYFGTGIIISLAFCHLLQESFENFSNPCIGTLEYRPTAPAIAMGSMLVIWLVDYFSARWVRSSFLVPNDNSTISPSINEIQPAPPPVFQDLGCGHVYKPTADELDPNSKRAHWDVELLEGGIIFHSIMIGVTLGAQTRGFEVTFAALVFHQLFEGLGLGTRIGALVWKRSWTKWLMCTMYALTTPIGIAIGIGVHQSFNENGRRELIAIGVLNSISAGILLYGGLCQLLFAEWVIGDMRGTSNARVFSALTALLLGVFAMALIGKWT